MTDHTTPDASLTSTDIPFDAPYKRRIPLDGGGERWVDVLADGREVECAAPVAIVVGVPTPTSARPSSSSSKAVTVLKVPFAEKEAAKALGARWDPKRKKWYVPQGVDAAPFSQWLE